MSSWAIVAIVAIAVWGFVQLRTNRHDREMGVLRDEDGNPVFPPATTDDGTRRELQELRERIKVLEQITVEGREAKAIADEIEKLRDR
jgi:hypothetical protein